MPAIKNKPVLIFKNHHIPAQTVVYDSRTQTFTLLFLSLFAVFFIYQVQLSVHKLHRARPSHTFIELHARHLPDSHHPVVVVAETPHHAVAVQKRAEVPAALNLAQASILKFVLLIYLGVECGNRDLVVGFAQHSVLSPASHVQHPLFVQTTCELVARRDLPHFDVPQRADMFGVLLILDGVVAQRHERGEEILHYLELAERPPPSGKEPAFVVERDRVVCAHNNVINRNIICFEKFNRLWSRVRF